MRAASWIGPIRVAAALSSVGALLLALPLDPFGLCFLFALTAHTELFALLPGMLFLVLLPETRHSGMCACRGSEFDCPKQPCFFTYSFMNWLASQALLGAAL